MGLKGPEFTLDLGVRGIRGFLHYGDPLALTGPDWPRWSKTVYAMDRESSIHQIRRQMARQSTAIPVPCYSQPAVFTRSALPVFRLSLASRDIECLL